MLFEISIVCHVLCSWLVGGWFFWLPAVLCLAFFSVISLVVGGLGVLPGSFVGVGCFLLGLSSLRCLLLGRRGVGCFLLGLLFLGGWVWVGVCSPYVWLRLFGCGFVWRV